MIELRNISKIYKTPEVKTQALDNVSLKINEGEFVAVTGQSGCGKTTLLNILGLLDTATSGDYLFFNKNITNYSERKRSVIRKNNVGFVFQNFNLIDELNVYRNVAMPLLYQKVTIRERRDRVFEILERLGMTDLRKKLPQQLSGGEQQRTAVARAMVNRPKFILADEPTGNLDSRNAEEVMSLLNSLHESGSTVIMVTHAKEYASYANRIIRLKDGIII